MQRGGCRKLLLSQATGKTQSLDPLAEAMPDIHEHDYPT